MTWQISGIAKTQSHFSALSTALWALNVCLGNFFFHLFHKEKQFCIFSTKPLARQDNLKHTITHKSFHLFLLR